MIIKSSRSRWVSFLSLALFLIFTVHSSYSGAMSSQESDAERYFKEGIQSLENGEYNTAIDRFTHVLELTKDKRLETETYVYLSLVNFYLGETYNAQNWIKRALDNDPNKKASSSFPSEYIDLFNKTKGEHVSEAKGKQKEAGAAPAEITEKKEPRRVAVKAGKKEEGSKKTLLMIGGALVAGAAVLLLVLKPWSADTGSIQVSSEPEGATVYLNDKLHSEKTNCTIDGLEPGSYHVEIDLEDYSLYEEDVTVVAGETVTVSVKFERPSIEVTSPDSDTIWKTGDNVTIKWDTTDAPYSISAAGMIQEVKNIQKMVRLRQTRSFRPNSPAHNGSEARTGNRKDSSARENRMEATRSSQIRQSTAKGSDEKNFVQPGNPRIVNGRDLNQSSFPKKLKSMGETQSLSLLSVKIELFKGESKLETIVFNTPNDGQYEWTVPYLGESGSNFKVRVSSANDESYNYVYGYSEAFTIESDETSDTN